VTTSPCQGKEHVQSVDEGGAIVPQERCPRLNEKGHHLVEVALTVSVPNLIRGKAAMFLLLSTLVDACAARGSRDIPHAL
jgi:hypothetical protein